MVGPLDPMQERRHKSVRNYLMHLLRWLLFMPGRAIGRLGGEKRCESPGTFSPLGIFAPHRGNAAVSKKVSQGKRGANKEKVTGTGLRPCWKRKFIPVPEQAVGKNASPAGRQADKPYLSSFVYSVFRSISNIFAARLLFPSTFSMTFWIWSRSTTHRGTVSTSTPPP